MPAYLFTIRAYASWLPDHPKGYTRRRKGNLPPDPHMAACYRAKMTQQPARFDSKAQRTIVAAVHEKADLKQWSAHAIATDPSHTHILISWHQPTNWLLVRRGLKASISRALNTQIHPRKWLAERGSRKRIKDRVHFDHLMQTYLPKHQGLVWIDPNYTKHTKPQ